ncbi:MAG TPA: adenosylmethionine decarboxylase [Acetobacteraceae bacterium]|nr:adenosylmethionine decarboxylase [Acetobacteraceae bacterium]
MIRSAGKHWLVEFYGAHALGDVRAIRRALRNAAAKSGATLLQVRLHHFGEGAGVTGVALLAESHISIHTWPERCYAAIDIFMCGRHCSPKKALESLRVDLQPARQKIRRILRHLPGTRR